MKSAVTESLRIYGIIMLGFKGRVRRIDNKEKLSKIHSWFGNHYKKIDSVTGTDDDGNKVNYDIVVIKTSPYMIVHLAMQYGTSEEIMDEEIRGQIKEELKEMENLYVK